MLVKVAQAYKAEIVMTCGHHRVNVKSIMGILTLGAEQGTKVTVTAQGHDAEKAIRAIDELFACCFCEEKTYPAAHPPRKEEQTVKIGRRRYGVANATDMSAALCQ
jgi:phosphotransferase system HPr (HPr) family protein